MEYLLVRVRHHWPRHSHFSRRRRHCLPGSYLVYPRETLVNGEDVTHSNRQRSGFCSFPTTPSKILGCHSANTSFERCRGSGKALSWATSDPCYGWQKSTVYVIIPYGDLLPLSLHFPSENCLVIGTPLYRPPTHNTTQKYVRLLTCI